MESLCSLAMTYRMYTSNMIYKKNFVCFDIGLETICEILEF